MRQTLFRIAFDATLSTPWGELPLFGAGLLLGLLLLGLMWRLIPHVRKHGFDGAAIEKLITAGVVGFVIYQLPNWMQSVPVYGFGAMLLLGFLTAGWLAGIRAQREGFSPELTWDAAMWIFIPGIIGARLFYVVQKWDEFAAGKSPFGILISLFNLPQGGLVLYGGVILGGVFYFVYCYRKKISPAYLADMVIPSIFVGEMFGRIGCFLNGCCFGDPTQLPWAVFFPPGSVPFEIEVNRGQILAQAACSLPLHPTQLYSSLNAGILALLTWHFFPFRRKDGEVLLLGWMIYPVTRICIEFLRGDEGGQLGTMFTISQWVSAGMLVSALLFWGYLSRKAEQYRLVLSDVSG